MPDLGWDAAAASGREPQERKTVRGRGAGALPLCQPRRRRRFQAHFRPGRAAVLKAQGCRPPQAVASGQWPASPGSTISSS